MTCDDRPSAPDAAGIKKKARRLLLFRFIALLMALGICEIGLRVVTINTGHIQQLLGKPAYYLVPFGVPERMPNIESKLGAYRRYDERIGWSIGPLGADDPLYFSDRFGLRCSQATYQAQLAANATPVDAREMEPVDVICIGDSFTHGDEVAFEASWPHKLAETTGLRVANLGVGGYGIDQAAMRYEYMEIRGKLVILGLIAGDLERARTQIYSFYTGGLKTKPMFRFGADGPIQIVNQPAIYGDALQAEFERGVDSEFFQNDFNCDPAVFQRHWFDVFYLYRVPRSVLFVRNHLHPPIYRTPGPALDDSIRILQHLNRLVEARQARLLILLLGNNNTFTDRKILSDPWANFRARLETAGLDYLSATDEIYSMWQQDPASAINATGVHYTPIANARVAEIVAASPSIRRLLGEQ